MGKNKMEKENVRVYDVGGNLIATGIVGEISIRSNGLHGENIGYKDYILLKLDSVEIVEMEDGVFKAWRDYGICSVDFEDGRRIDRCYFGSINMNINIECELYYAFENKTEMNDIKQKLWL